MKGEVISGKDIKPLKEKNLKKEKTKKELWMQKVSKKTEKIFGSPASGRIVIEGGFSNRMHHV